MKGEAAELWPLPEPLLRQWAMEPHCLHSSGTQTDKINSEKSPYKEMTSVLKRIKSHPTGRGESVFQISHVILILLKVSRSQSQQDNFKT